MKATNFASHGIIAYHVAFRKIAGSTVAAIMLSQLVYWWPRRQGEAIYKTIPEMEEETGLTRKEQDTAIRHLKERGFISVSLKKVDGAPVRHFVVNMDAIDAALDALEGQMELPDRDKSWNCPNGANRNARSGQNHKHRLHTETTRKDIGADAPAPSLFVAEKDGGGETSSSEVKEPPSGKASCVPLMAKDVAPLVRWWVREYYPVGFPELQLKGDDDYVRRISERRMVEAVEMLDAYRRGPGVRKPLTWRALETILDEAAEADPANPSRPIYFMVDRGWRGFRAEWYRKAMKEANNEHME